MRAYISWKKIQKIINSFCCSKLINLNLPRSEIPHVGIVFLGGEATGKSTIMGHYLYLSGHIDRRTIMKFEKESMEDYGNPFGKYSWAAGLVRKNERNLHRTIHLKSFNFKINRRSISFWETEQNEEYYSWHRS